MTAAPGPRPGPRPRRRPARPRPRAPLPARLGGGAHSSSSASSSGGAPGRSGLRAFQRVWTSMPAGRGSGRAGTLAGAGRARAAESAGPQRPQGVMGSRRPPVPFVAAALRGGSAGALAHGQEGSTSARGAAGTPLGSLARASSNASDACSPALAAAAPRPATRGRSARARSCAGRGDEECGPRRGRRALSSQVPPSLAPGRHPRRLSIPDARSKSEPGAARGRAGPRLPLGAGGEGVGTVGESQRGRGWPGAGADAGRARRPRRLEERAPRGEGAASEPRSPPGPPLPPPDVRAPGRAPGTSVEGPGV